ncbi:MAG: hypothetical protein JSR46_09990 [Verrucomicrobia bacterium]|nr:hypothetical protein [Verrucomicrobiota bacterium]
MSYIICSCCSTPIVEDETSSTAPEQRGCGCVWHGREIRRKPVNWCVCGLAIVSEIAAVFFFVFVKDPVHGAIQTLPPPAVGYSIAAFCACLGIAAAVASTFTISKND